MARSTSTDTRYLEKKDGKYRVVVSVPRGLHAEFSTKLKHPLHTDSLAVANQLKWQVVAELKARLSGALKRGGRDPLAREALNIAALRSRAQTHEDRANIKDGISVRLDQILGSPVSVEHLPSGVEEAVHDPERVRQAKAYADLAYGKAIPLAHHHPEYLKGLTVKPRTRADDERALRYLEDWCSQNRVPPTLHAINRKVAMLLISTES
ncbi:hypothetical protein ASG43_19545 [Aureimonas sp. Leaf454]|uniref:hypothetical protein n=1 Tax=Aureimonas sp. Leaf454 TaxID=1736381 RepID=UPI000700879F|nr:hypothetical protein [Aureimonas sp. Leaf454]KQT52657.1 hypothetical protein ASG43_19545 [Aureimonas sp. Leaf454]